MNFSIHHSTSPDKKILAKVNILGSFENSEEVGELITILDNSDSTSFDISFFDAETIPAELIKAITKALDRNVEIKLRAYRQPLSDTLSRLSLPVLPMTSQEQRSVLLQNCRAVALACSAKTIDKILTIIENLPDSDSTLFIAFHFQEDQLNLLDNLLKMHTNYTVIMPQHLTKVSPNTIYISPPGHHMKVSNGFVYLTNDRKINFSRPSVDVLFESLSTEYGPDLLAVLLNGLGEDGVAGCVNVRSSGGCVLIEEGHESSIATIASVVAAAVSSRDIEVGGHLLDLYLEGIFKLTGYDFRQYQRGTIERRISSLIKQSGYASFFDFQRESLSNSQMVQRVLTALSINVTELFRHPEQFLKLRESILPYLASFPMIKIWSAGTATGEEAFSLAILLDELGLLEKSRIFATDINLNLLELGEAGLLPKEMLEKSYKNYTDAGGKNFFHHIKDCGRYLQISERIRKHILFHHHALGQDGVFNEFQLIICQNVMIYFDQNLQRRVFDLFSKSLHREGFLFLGPKDGLREIAKDCQFTATPHGAHIYRFNGEYS